MLTLGTDRFVEALARMEHLAARDRQGRPHRPPPTVAISRQAGSQGAEIARLVGEELGWPVYDHELLKRIADEKGLHQRIVERLDERHAGWLEELITDFCLGGGAREVGYLKSLLGQFVALSEQGRCVIVGRGAPMVLPAETTLRVRVLAPRATRIEMVEKTRGISRAEAERWIDRTAAERKGFVKHYFNRDVEDPMGYDLLLNSGRLSLRTCAELIAEAARAMEAKVAG